MISYTIDVSKKSNLITHVIVSTDDEEIAHVAKECGGDVPFMRPKELAEDETPHLPVMEHAISFMEDREGITFDYAVVLQPTSPFRLADDIDGTVQKMIDTGADGAVSIQEVEAHSHPMKIKKLEGDFVRPYCVEEEGTQRQDLPVAYKRSGAVYAVKHDVLMVGKRERFHDENVVGYVVPQERSIDIDTPLDWIKAEYMLSKLKEKGLEF